MDTAPDGSEVLGPGDLGFLNCRIGADVEKRRVFMWFEKKIKWAALDVPAAESVIRLLQAGIDELKAAEIVLEKPA